MSTKVISLALFGEKTRYAVYAGAVIRAYKTLFPDFEIWLHHDRKATDSNYGKTLQRLEKSGIVRLFNMGDAPLTAAMLWRLRPIWQEDVQYVFCRDIDALATPRERACIDRFIDSGLALHTIHDSMAHAGIMGGLCGFQAQSFKRIIGLTSLNDLYSIAGYTDAKWSIHGSDQDALNAFVAPWMQGQIFEHMFNGWNGGHSNDPPVPPRRPSFQGISEYVPDAVTLAGRGADWISKADSMISHMGGAGFDIEAATRFYDETGPEREMAVIREAETSAGGNPWT